MRQVADEGQLVGKNLGGRTPAGLEDRQATPGPEEVLVDASRIVAYKGTSRGVSTHREVHEEASASEACRGNMGCLRTFP